MASKSVKDNLNDFYYGIENKFFGLMDFVDDRGIPVYRVIDALEDKNIPVFPLFLTILFIGLVAFFMLGTPASGTLQVKVVDSETGAAIEGADVRITYPDTLSSFIGKTDSKGIATIEDFDRLNSYGTVEITKYDYETLDRSFYFTSLQQDFSLSKLEKTNVKVVMRVTTDFDSIVREGTVKVMKEGEDLGTYAIKENGVIEAIVPQGQYIDFVFSSPGYQEKSETFTFNSDQELPITLEADESEPADLLVYVEDINGDAVEGAEVEARPKGVAELASSQETDVDGKTVLRGLIPGLYNVTVSKEEYLSRTEKDVQVLSNAENKLEMIVSTADFANSDFINVTARTMTGTPLEAAVNVYLDGILVKSQDIDGTGKVLVDKSKKYMVSVYSGSYVPFVKTDVGAGESVLASMELSTKENTSTLKVCVREEDTKAPLNGVPVVLFETASKVLGIPSGLTGSSGCAEFGEVPNNKTVIAKAYVGSKVGVAEPVETPTTQEPMIDISATQTKVTVKVTKEENPVSGASVVIFDNSATVLGKELSSPAVTDSRGVAEFDVVEGIQAYAVVESPGSAKYFSHVINIDSSKENRIDVQLFSPADSTGAVFIGLFDKFGNKVESVVESKQYRARVALNTVAASDEAGLFLMAGLEENDFSAKDNVAITGVMQAMGEPSSGTTYNPPLGQDIDMAGTTLSGQMNKWVQVVGKDVGRGTHVVDFAVQVKDNVILGERVKFNFRGWTYINLGGVERSPVDEELGTLTGSEGKQPLYAATTPVEFSVTQNTVECTQEICMNYGFSKAITGEKIKDLTGSEAYLSAVYSLGIEVQAKQDLEDLQVEVLNSDASLDFVSYHYLGTQTQLDDEAHSLAVNLESLGKNRGTDLEAVFVPTSENNSASIKIIVKRSGEVLIEKELFLKVVAGLGLSVFVEPEMAVAGEKTKFTITVFRAGDFEAVTDATIKLVNNIGKPLGNKTITITGKDKRDRGRNGVYATTIEPASGVIAVNVSADHFAEETILVRVGKEAAIAIDEDPFVIGIPLNIKTATKQLAIKNISSKKLTDLQVVVERDEDFPDDDFSLELDDASITRMLGPGETTYLTFTSGYFPDSADSASAEATIKVFAVKDNEYVTARGRIKLLYAPKIDAQVIAECLEVTPSQTEFVVGSEDLDTAFNSMEVVLKNNCGLDLSNVVAYSGNDLDGGIFVLDFNGNQVIEGTGEENTVIEMLSADPLSGENKATVLVTFQADTLDDSENNAEKGDVVGTLVFRGENGSQDVSGELDYSVVFLDEAAALDVESKVKLKLKAGESLNILDGNAEKLVLKNSGSVTFKNIRLSEKAEGWEINPNIYVSYLSETEASSTIDELEPEDTTHFEIEVDASGYSGEPVKMTGTLVIDADVYYKDKPGKVTSVSREVGLIVEIVPEQYGCIKILGAPVVNLLSATPVFEKIKGNLAVKNECGKKIKGLVVNYPLGDFKLNVGIEGSSDYAISDGETVVLEFVLEKKSNSSVVSDNFTTGINIEAELSNGEFVSSDEVEVNVDIGSNVKESSFTRSYSVDSCDPDGGTQMVSISRKAGYDGDCSDGYCDGVQAAEYIVKNADDFAEEVLEFIGDKKAGDLGCGSGKEDICVFEELLQAGFSSRYDWMINGLDLFLMDDRLTLKAFQNAKDNLQSSNIKGQVVVGDYEHARSDSIGSGAIVYDYDSDDALDKCGWYKIKFKPVFFIRDEELSKNRFSIFIETSYVGATKTCEGSALHLSTLLPWDSAVDTQGKQLDTTEMKETVFVIPEGNQNLPTYRRIVEGLASGLSDVEGINFESSDLSVGYSKAASMNRVYRTGDAGLETVSSEKNTVEIKIIENTGEDHLRSLGLTDDEIEIFGFLNDSDSFELSLSPDLIPPGYGIIRHRINNVGTNTFEFFVYPYALGNKTEDLNNSINTAINAFVTIAAGAEPYGCQYSSQPGEGPKVNSFVILNSADSAPLGQKNAFSSECVFVNGVFGVMKPEFKGAVDVDKDGRTVVVKTPEALASIMACECSAVMVSFDTDTGIYGGYRIRYTGKEDNPFTQSVLIEEIKKLREDGNEPANLLCVAREDEGSFAWGGKSNDCHSCKPELRWDGTVKLAEKTAEGVPKDTTFRMNIEVEENEALVGRCPAMNTACTVATAAAVVKAGARVAQFAGPQGLAASAGLFLAEQVVDFIVVDEMIKVGLQSMDTNKDKKVFGTAIMDVSTVTRSPDFRKNAAIATLGITAVPQVGYGLLSYGKIGKAAAEAKGIRAIPGKLNLFRHFYPAIREYKLKKVILKEFEDAKDFKLPKGYQQAYRGKYREFFELKKGELKGYKEISTKWDDIIKQQDKLDDLGKAIDSKNLELNQLRTDKKNILKSWGDEVFDLNNVDGVVDDALVTKYDDAIKTASKSDKIAKIREKEIKSLTEDLNKIIKQTGDTEEMTDWKAAAKEISGAKSESIKAISETRSEMTKITAKWVDSPESAKKIADIIEEAASKTPKGEKLDMVKLQGMVSEGTGKDMTDVDIKKLNSLSNKFNNEIKYLGVQDKRYSDHVKELEKVIGNEAQKEKLMTRITEHQNALDDLHTKQLEKIYGVDNEFLKITGINQQIAGGGKDIAKLNLDKQFAEESVTKLTGQMDELVVKHHEYLSTEGGISFDDLNNMAPEEYPSDSVKRRVFTEKMDDLAKKTENISENVDGLKKVRGGSLGGSALVAAACWTLNATITSGEYCVITFEEV